MHRVILRHENVILHCLVTAHCIFNKGLAVLLLECVFLSNSHKTGQAGLTVSLLIMATHIFKFTFFKKPHILSTSSFISSNISVSWYLFFVYLFFGLKQHYSICNYILQQFFDCYFCFGSLEVFLFCLSFSVSNCSPRIKGQTLVKSCSPPAIFGRLVPPDHFVAIPLWLGTTPPCYYAMWCFKMSILIHSAVPKPSDQALFGGVREGSVLFLLLYVVCCTAVL